MSTKPKPLTANPPYLSTKPPDASELAAAAERLTATVAEAVKLGLKPSYADSAQCLADALLVANSWMAEHHGDSDEPIDEAYLRSATHVTRVVEAGDCKWYLIDGKLEISRCFGRRWEVVIGSFSLELKTRSDLRLLCRALRIPLKESP